MVRDGRDPEVIPESERRHGPRRGRAGRRADDEAAEMGTDDLRALIEAYRRAGDRERDDRLREHAEIVERLRAVEERYANVNARLIRWGAVFAIVVGVLAWFGPTRLSTLIKALAGVP